MADSVEPIWFTGRGGQQIGDRFDEKHQKMGQLATAREQQRRREAEGRAAARSPGIQVVHAILSAAHAQHASNASHAVEEIQLGSDWALHRRAPSFHHHRESSSHAKLCSTVAKFRLT